MGPAGPKNESREAGYTSHRSSTVYQLTVIMKIWGQLLKENIFFSLGEDSMKGLCYPGK